MSDDGLSRIFHVVQLAKCSGNVSAIHLGILRYQIEF